MTIKEFNNQLQAWELETNKLTEIFVKKYFKDADWYWIGKDIGGVIEVNNFFFNFDRIREALKYKASAKKLFAYYDLEVEDKTDISFYAYLKMK